MDIKQNVTTNSAEEPKNGKAGNTSDGALKDENERKAAADERIFEKSTVPLFLRGRSEGHQGNAQDEKDEVGE